LKLKLNNEADLQAAAEIAGLQNGEGIVVLLAGYAYTQTTGSNEPFTAIISKSLLADSYKGNPSLLAAKVLVRLQRDDGDWESCSGHLTSPTHITVRLSMQAKERNVRTTLRPSVKGTIKAWIALDEPRFKRLRLPIASIPDWYVSHPEQLTYAIKQETQVPIKITKLTKSWLVSRK